MGARGRQRNTEHYQSVKDLLLKGCSAQEIADALKIKKGTADTYIRHILEDNNVDSTLKVLAYEIEKLQEQQETIVSSTRELCARIYLKHIKHCPTHVWMAEQIRNGKE